MNKKFFMIILVVLLTMVSGCYEKTNDVPTVVTIWNYYNGDQLAAFETLIEEFNNSVGIKKGYVVVSESQGNINDLADSLIASVRGDAGAKDKPTLAAVYSETAYILDNQNALINLDNYFSEKELNKFIPGFIEEGRFNQENELLLFPISKSTELFTANETDWKTFEDACGISLSSITTKEELTAAAKTYYEWTDSLTPELEDGKALYGRDSVSNYIFIGSYQLGHELFNVKNGELTVNLDKETFKTLWDNYYIPFINGYFGAYGKFRSDDCKTGKILSLTSSSSSVSYLPTQVTDIEDSKHDITTYESIDLPFENAVNDAIVQQGAGYCLLKSGNDEIYGAIEFLKWFTEDERNLKFALMSSYFPATKNANTKEAITNAYSGNTDTEKGKNVLNGLILCADAFVNKEAYASKPFNGSKDVRTILGDSLQNITIKDRAEVVKAISEGKSRSEATSVFTTDAYFETWYNKLVEQINNIINK